MALRVYGDSVSGNCLKVKWILDRLKVAYDWIETDVTTGATRTPEFLAMNPAGQVPLVVLEDGRGLAQSNAILLYFAEDTELTPIDAYQRGKMYEWMFWEQYSHEPYIAVRRFHLHYLGKSPEDLDPRLFERGSAALQRMEAALQPSDAFPESGPEWLVGDRISLADIALVAYTRVAHQGGFDLSFYPAVTAWVARVEDELGIGRP